MLLILIRIRKIRPKLIKIPQKINGKKIFIFWAKQGCSWGFLEGEDEDFQIFLRFFQKTIEN